MPSSGNSTFSGWRDHDVSLTTSRGGLVEAHAEQARVAQLAVHGPLDERDLHDDLRPHPVRARRGRPVARVNGDCRDLDGVEAGAQIEQQLACRSRCRPCRRTRSRRRRSSRRAARRGRRALPCGSVKPPTTSSCAGLALHLQPVRRAAVLVGRVATLRDHAFPALARRPAPTASSSSSAARAAAARRSGSASSSARRSSSGSVVTSRPSSHSTSKT